KHTGASDYQEGHARGQHAIREAQLTSVFGMLRLFPITKPVDVSQKRNEKDRQQENGRQAVDRYTEMEGKSGQTPLSDDITGGNRLARSLDPVTADPT